jgi:putative addiction module killer protein
MLPFIIRQHPEFIRWFAGLPDKTTRLRLARRLDKAKRGLFGDVKHIGDGVFEMREDFGPGWRMYYAKRGAILIVMLGGGDKSTQRADITAARSLAATLED